MSEQTMMVAETIKAQLGGNRAFYMIGAKDVLALDGNGGLQFSFMKNKLGAAKVRVELADDDTYTVRFFGRMNRRTFDVPELKAIEGVYVDSLRRIFEAETGLYLSL